MSDEYISLQDARFYVAAIIDELNDLVEHGCMDIADLDWRVLMEKILRINDLLTADVTPVVRCKDCKYYEEHHYEREGEPPYIKGKCGNKFGLNRQYMVHPEEFCSRGERRE